MNVSRVAAVLAAAFCTACSGTSAERLFPASGTTLAGDTRAHAKVFQLAVSEYGSNSVQVFDKRYQTTRTITSGVSGPLSTWYDRKTDSLYVANSKAGTVTEYAQSASSPTFTYSSGLSCPDGVTTDKHENVYVTDFCNNTVGEYPQGVNRMLAQCGAGGTPQGIAVDSSGDVYFAVGYQIAVYVNRSGAGSALTGCDGPGSTIGGLAGATCLMFDESGNLIVCQVGCSSCFPPTPPQIDIVPPPYSTIAQIWLNFSGPTGVALNEKQNRLYVADNNGEVEIVTYPNDRVLTTLGPSDGVTSAFGVAAYPNAPEN